MVIFARNRKLCASAATASYNQGESYSVRANGPQACVQKGTDSL
jgi:hypothetical protein